MSRIRMGERVGVTYFQTGFKKGTLDASGHEHCFSLHANWAEQSGDLARCPLLVGERT